MTDDKDTPYSKVLKDYLLDSYDDGRFFYTKNHYVCVKKVDDPFNYCMKFNNIFLAEAYKIQLSAYESGNPLIKDVKIPFYIPRYFHKYFIGKELEGVGPIIIE
jgi:hypothetical protein